MNRKIIAANQAGFSLIEALIAALVVGIGLLGLARLQGSSFTGIAESRIQNAASHFAQRQIEDVLRTAESKAIFTNLLVSPNQDSCAPDHDNDPKNDKDCHGSNATLTREWSSKNCEPDTTLPCKIIDLTVSWVDAAGKNTGVSSVSYIAITEPVDAGIAIANLTP